MTDLIPIDSNWEFEQLRRRVQLRVRVHIAIAPTLERIALERWIQTKSNLIEVPIPVIRAIVTGGMLG